MRIDNTTTNKDFAPLASLVGEDGMERLRKAAVSDLFGDAGFYGMTVGQLTSVVSGDIKPLLRHHGETLYDTLRVEAFGKFIDDLAATLQRLTLAPTPETARLTAGTLQSDFAESVYVFCRNYFGLPSFEAADTLKVTEWLLARKDDYNRQLVERNAAAMARKGGRP